MTHLEPLIEEHRLIERLLILLAHEKTRLEDNIAAISPAFAFVEPRLLNAFASFLQGYAAAFHQAKEEAILFPFLEQKARRPVDRQLLQQWKEEHRRLDALASQLDAAKERYLQGDEAALPAILAAMGDLINLYGRHLTREEKELFAKLADYLDETDLAALAAAMAEYDQGRDLQAYAKLVADWEAPGCKCHL